MKVTPARLAEFAEQGLPRAILVHSGEPLLVEETLNTLRAVLTQYQFNERLRLNVDARFDWSELSQEANAMSLFSDRRCFELRMPTGRPGDKGAAAIKGFCSAADPDSMMVVISGRLDRSQLNSKWVKAINSAGWLVDCGEVAGDAFLPWLRQRLQSRGLRVEQGVHELLAWQLEGNLLAAAQEVDKLKVLARDGAVTLDMVNQSLGDQARFSTFILVDTCLQGEAARAVRILTSLRIEGVRPELVVWTLAREIRTLNRIAGAIDHGRSRSSVFRENRVWSRREHCVSAALGRFSLPDWCTMIGRVSWLDRLSKGQAGPVSREGLWYEIELLCLALAGADIITAQEPGNSYGAV